jgi:soluble lytic murein transglycosylase
MKIKCTLIALWIVVLLAGCLGPASVIPTETNSPILQQVITPTETTVFEIPPSPSPVPELRIESGEQAFFNGDYDQAYYEFQTALDTSTESDMRASALWGLGRVFYALKNYAQALEILQQLTENYPASTNANRAYFIMGEIYSALDRYSEAAQAYSTYIALLPGVIDDYVQIQRGDAFSAAGNDTEAITAYQAAAALSPVENVTAIQIKIAQSFFNLGDLNTALGMYDSIFSATSSDYLKAQMDLLSGRIYLVLGQTEQAYQRFLHTVNNYPLSPDSYSALVALVNDGVPVDDLNRGLVDYYAGQYGYAHDALQRYIDLNPQNDGTALYYKALTLFALGQYEDAILAWDEFIQRYPDNPHWAAAWNGNSSLPGRAFTQWYFLGQSTIAAQSLLTFVQQAPADPNAPIYLLEAGRLQERDGILEEAAQTWERIAVEYPGSELVPQALFLAGIARYRLGNYGAALVSFQRDFILASLVEDQTRAQFWIGKTQQALGDITSAESTWQQTAAFDATDYYSLRAQDVLFSRPAFVPLSAINLNIDLPSERNEADAWLRVTFNLPPDTDLSNPGALTSDPRFIRGTEFWLLGLPDESRSEFDDLRTSIEANPADCYRLANYLLDLGFYYPAVFTIRQVLTLAGMNSQTQTLAAPAYFNHFRYGLYYKDLILLFSQRVGLDPLILWSVMRQESLFDKYANSGYAIGLMQIAPGTGQFIVENHGWPPNYSSSDLDRPIINIGLGATYLMDQRNRFDGELFTTLAAYNAGPEAAAIWRDLSGPDPDLFLEVVRYQETRNYIASIYEIFAMYSRLYATDQ